MKIDKDILKYIEEKRQLWYRHVIRANETRQIKRVTDWSSMGRRKRGRPRDEINEIMERRGLKGGESEKREKLRLWQVPSAVAKLCLYIQKEKNISTDNGNFSRLYWQNKYEIEDLSGNSNS